MTRVAMWGIFGLVSSCRISCDERQLNSDLPAITASVPPHLHRASISLLVRAETFPPRWKVGQTWQVMLRPRAKYKSNKSVFYPTTGGSSVFSFVVTAGNEDQASVDSQPQDIYTQVPLDTPNTERQVFGLKPFSLRETWRVDGWSRAVERVFVGDGGLCYESDTCGMPVPSEEMLDENVGRLETQASEPMENGIRFYFGADKPNPTVIEWLKGDPWWSRMYILDKPEPATPGLGTDWARLVRAEDGTPMSPPPPPAPTRPAPDAAH